VKLDPRRVEERRGHYALKVLRKLEWSALKDINGTMVAACPMCGGVQPTHEVLTYLNGDKGVGHLKSCELAKALAS
jgi:hypothetical protein